MRAQEFFKRNDLEDQVGLAPTIDNADMASVDLGQAGIGPGESLVEEKVMVVRPSHAVVETHLDRLIDSSDFRMGVGEKQHMLFLALLLIVDADQASVAGRLDQGVQMGG